MTKVPSPDHRIVLMCDGCLYWTPEMTQAELDQFGTPWYCPECALQMKKFVTFLPHEKPAWLNATRQTVMEGVDLTPELRND